MKSSALISAAGIAAPSLIGAAAESKAAAAGNAPSGKVITSAPMLQNFAPDSIGVAFCVDTLVNPYVKISTNPDLSGARLCKSGGFRVTELADKIAQVRIRGLKPATKYYYRIGADTITYNNGHSMKKTGTVEDPRTYSFTTAGAALDGSFCVINDTHVKWPAFEASVNLISKLAPSCVIWNGDAISSSETMEMQQQTFFNPEITKKDYACEIPFLLCPGNHENRGMANRHLERAWMFRCNEERSSRDWDLGRNFAFRLGDIALIGLDTAEDKVDENPRYAGLFNSAAYREAQTKWLADTLKRKEIKSAKHIVAFCHIPLFDDDPTQNPGDIHPNDTDPRYSTDYAHWQRTCGNMWTPLLQKAGCRVIISGHQHRYRVIKPSGSRKWTQIIGGGPEFGHDKKFPTVIKGHCDNGRLKITVYRADTGSVIEEFEF